MYKLILKISSSHATPFYPIWLFWNSWMMYGQYVNILAKKQIDYINKKKDGHERD